MSYLFYDLETTGLNRAFDQVLECAAIRTDEELRPVDRHRIRVRLRSDIVPAPEAVLTYRLDLEEILEHGRAEVDAVREIHSLLNEPGTISLGYETLSFDDEMLRFSFFRNLLSPYTHQWDNNCGRMDLSPMTTVYWLKNSEALQWPDAGDAGPLLTLEAVNAANGFVEQPLVSAEARVKVALRLARALRQDRPLWNQLKDQFDRNIDRDSINKLPLFSIGRQDYRVGLMVSGHFGPENNYQRPVICLGKHRRYNNQTAWLALDSAKLRGAGSRPITRHTDVISRKFGVPHFLFSPANQSVARLDDKRRMIARRNSRWLQDHPDVFQQIAGYYLEHTYPDPPNIDVDAALYPFGFLEDRQVNLCERFHQADTIEEKLGQIDAFESSVLGELATRVILRNYPPEQWSQSIQRYARWYQRRLQPEHSADILRDHRGVSRRTPAYVRQRIAELRRQRAFSPVEDELLDELEQYTEDAFHLRNWRPNTILS
jgi:exodeoxyribonuclease-1